MTTKKTPMRRRKPTTISPDVEEAVVQPSCFWLATCTIIMQEGAMIRMNVLLETPSAMINKAILTQLHQLAISSAVKNQGIKPESIASLIVDNLALLAQTTPEEFHRELPRGPVPVEPDA